MRSRLHKFPVANIKTLPRNHKHQQIILFQYSLMSAQISRHLYYFDASKISKAEMQRNVYQLDEATVHGELKVDF